MARTASQWRSMGSQDDPWGSASSQDDHGPQVSAQDHAGYPRVSWFDYSDHIMMQIRFDMPEMNPKMALTLTRILHDAQVPLDRLGTLAWVPEVMCFRLSLCHDEQQRKELAALVPSETVMLGLHATGSQQVSQILAQGFSSSVNSFGSPVDQMDENIKNSVNKARRCPQNQCNVMVEIGWHGKCIKIQKFGWHGNSAWFSPFMKPGQFVHYKSDKENFYCTAKEDVIPKALWVMNSLNYTVSARFGMSGDSVQLPDGTPWWEHCTGQTGLSMLQLSLAKCIGKMHDRANICCNNIELSYIGKTHVRWRSGTRLSAAEVFGTDTKPQVSVVLLASPSPNRCHCQTPGYHRFSKTPHNF